MGCVYDGGLFKGADVLFSAKRSTGSYELSDCSIARKEGRSRRTFRCSSTVEFTGENTNTVIVSIVAEIGLDFAVIIGARSLHVSLHKIKNGRAKSTIIQLIDI